MLLYNQKKGRRQENKKSLKNLKKHLTNSKQYSIITIEDKEKPNKEGYR